MQIITSKERPKHRLTVQANSLGGGRKTSMSCHLPTEDHWSGEIIYICGDKTSLDLDSVQPNDRDRLILVTLDGNLQEKNGKLITDWKKEMAQVCHIRWKEKFPNAIAVVYDTVTGTAGKLLLENMKMGYFSTKGPSSSGLDPKDPRYKLEKEEEIKLGDMGDYRMVKEAVLQNIDWLIDLNPDLHIFCLFQEGASQHDPKTGQGMVIGPSIVGRSGPREVPYSFGVNLHFDVDASTGKTEVLCQTRDKYVANIKTPRGSEVPQTKLVQSTGDVEEVREFWRWIEYLKS